jgi:2-dehydro-3-deoxygluconokinase
VLIANEEDLQSALGFDVPRTRVVAGQLDVDAYREVAMRVSGELGPSLVAITLRESTSASDNGWSAVAWDAARGAWLRSPRYDVRLVDRIGAGDSFAAGLIHELVTGRDAARALPFAVAASALKQTIPGDFNRVTVADVNRLVEGDASGRVQR